MKVVILGLGITGCSLGIDLQSAGARGHRVVGYDTDARRRSQAEILGAVDETAEHVDGLAEAAVVFIAVESTQLDTALRDLRPNLTPGTVVSHVGPLAGPGLALAESLLPPGIPFVGSHLVGTVGEPRDGDDGSPVWYLVPGPGSTAEAISLLGSLARATGRRPLIIDANEHDTYVAGTHQLPILVRAAMFALIAGSEGWRDLTPFAGPVRSTSTAMPSAAEIVANRNNVAAWIDRMQHSLASMSAMLAEADLHAIQDVLDQLELHEALLHVEEVQPSKPGFTQQVAESLFGRGIGKLWSRREAP
jgi:prephenate dehydrogenase